MNSRRLIQSPPIARLRALALRVHAGPGRELTPEAYPCVTLQWHEVVRSREIPLVQATPFVPRPCPGAAVASHSKNRARSDSDSSVALPIAAGPQEPVPEIDAPARYRGALYVHLCPDAPSQNTVGRKRIN